MTLCRLSEECRGLKVGLRNFWKRQTESQVGLVPPAMNEFDDMANPSPFTSQFYANQMVFSEGVGATEDDFNTLDPAQDLTDFLNGKDIAPKKQGDLPPLADPKVLDSFVTLTPVTHPSLVPIFKGDKGGFLVDRPNRPSKEEVDAALDRYESILEAFEQITRKVDFNAKQITPTIEILRSHRRRPNSQSRNSADISSILDQINLPARLGVKPSHIWKSAPDFAKYVQSISCDFIQRPKMLRVADGDESALDSMELSEIQSFNNINESIMAYNLSKTRSLEEVKTINFIRQGLQLCGWDKLAEGVIRIAKNKMQRYEQIGYSQSLKEQLESLNKETGEELQRRVSLFLMTTRTDLGSPNKKLEQAYEVLKITLRKIENKAAANVATPSLVPLQVSPDSTMMTNPIQIRLINQPKSDANNELPANMPATVELTPETFLAIATNDPGYNHLLMHSELIFQPLSELEPTDFARLANYSVGDQRMTIIAPSLQTWTRLHFFFQQRASVEKANPVVQRASQNAGQIYEYLKKIYQADEALKRD